ncbi:MAG: hypothetical protein QOH63_3635 [Acidobacteriota bacterium]|jgi:broad specificity phosphatase PhoE|nr:hypothetical protein [Acidobacteriota bacterium]
MHRLYLVRHGENRANVSRVFSSRRINKSLTHKGILQAQQTAEYFRDKGIDGIYSSPLKRATETANIIAAQLNLKIIIKNEFSEVDVGSLEGKLINKENWGCYNKIIKDWSSGKIEIAFPNGENYKALWNRMQKGIEKCISDNESNNIIIVGHVGIFTHTLKDLCPAVDIEWLYLQPNHNCSISEIIMDKQDGYLKGSLIRWAYFAHLHGRAAELIKATPEYFL